jgi:hypothetical protein
MPIISMLWKFKLEELKFKFKFEGTLANIVRCCLKKKERKRNKKLLEDFWGEM